MKHAASIASFLLLSFAFPVLAETPADPEQKMSAIEERFLSGDRRGAVREAEAWKKAESQAPWPWLAAASLAFHEKRFKRCLSQAQAALDRSPQNAEAYYWRGRCYEASGKGLDAANEYRAALKAEAAHPGAHEALARLEGVPGSGNPTPTAN